MNILATGETSRIEELKQKLSSDIVLKVVNKSDLSKANLNDFNIILELNFDDAPD